MYVTPDGFKFSFHKTLSNDVELWRCVQISCKCFFKCKNNVLINESSSHNHACNEESILLRQVISNSAKRKGLEDICERLSKILHR